MSIFAQRFGLHPLVALAVILIDTMLFGSDLLAFETAGVTLAVSIGVAALLTIPSILLQKYAYKDNWGTAVGKGLIVGILTGIPTSIPSIVTGAGGVLGIVGLISQRTGGKKAKTKTRARASASSTRKTARPRKAK